MSKSLFVRTRQVRIARLRRKRWRERIMARLARLEELEVHPQFQDDHRIAWLTVLNCSEGHADPWRYSFWCYLGKVPEKIIPELIARERNASAWRFLTTTHSAIRSAKYESRHRALGLCIKCQIPAGPISTILCELHRKRNVQANRDDRDRVPRILRGLRADHLRPMPKAG